MEEIPLDFKKKPAKITTVYQDEDSSTQDNKEAQSVQNFTYYYSSFELFDEITEFSFIRYQKFVKKLHNYLGGDWEMYASNTVYQMLEDVKKFLTNDEVFDIALQAWLETQNNYKKKRKSSTEDIGSLEGSNRDEIYYYEENEIFEQFLVKFQQNLYSYQINYAFFKPVAHGFFMSAVEIWNETIKQIKNQIVLSENSLFELGQQKEKELEEQLQKQKNLKSQFESKNYNQGSYIDKLYQKVQNIGQQNQIIKPLIVASETIIGYLGAKKVKENKNNSPKSEKQDKDEENYQKMNQAQHKNFNSFKDNLLSEEEVVMQKIRKISMQEQTLNKKRRQTELQMEQESSNSQDDTKSVVSVENFPKKAEKLNEQVYNFATGYFSNLKKNTQEKWQVARGFVTNIIELNNNILSKTQKISSEYTSSIKIRFLQPAQQFYNHLMEIWILFRQNQSSTSDFKLYLEKVKTSMGSRWSETYVLPTQYFFKTLVYTWDNLVKEQKESVDEDTLIKLFVERVRSNMLNNWENDIVNKIKHFKGNNNNNNSQQTKEERIQEHQQMKNQLKQQQNQNNIKNYQNFTQNNQQEEEQQHYQMNLQQPQQQNNDNINDNNNLNQNFSQGLNLKEEDVSNDQENSFINKKMKQLNINDSNLEQQIQQQNQQDEVENYELKKIQVDEQNQQNSNVKIEEQ